MTYEEFATARLAALLRYALMLTGDPHTAADVVQDTMIRAQLKWRQVSRAESPERYVRRMLTNAYLDWRRGSWFKRVTLRAEPDERGTGFDRVAGADHAELSAERDEMWTLLSGLPRRQRAAVVLRYYEGLSDAEIAATLDCAVGTVRGYISRALSTLRAAMVPVEAVTGDAEGGIR